MSEQSIDVTEIWISKTDLTKTQVQHKTLAASDLTEGQVILKIDSFGFSANNITYGLLGDRLGYWGFFPADEGWGKIPVWGFATVQASAHPDVKEGEKVFGYLPMASHLLITAGKTSDYGFYDVSEQRRSISPVYDNYVRCAADPGYHPAMEAWQLNFRPLFMTSFVLDDFVGEQIDTNVTDIIITSASSKTAYGTAFLASAMREVRGQKYRVIGLTSARNVQNTEQLGCYDQVVSYDELDAVSVSNQAWVLDFAGNKQLLLDIDKLNPGKIEKMLFIGVTDVSAQAGKPSGEVKGEMFFAPSQVKKRNSEWGQAEFGQRYARAWQGVHQKIAHLLTEHEVNGTQGIVDTYLTTLSGKVNNSHLPVLRF